MMRIPETWTGLRPSLFSLANRMPAVAWIVLAWALAVLPNLTIRSYIWEEGLQAEVARHFLETGDVLDPVVYGVRHLEKPRLYPLLVAAVARATSAVDEWSARLPAMLAVLATAIMVQRFVRRYVGHWASLFAAACFVFCPMLLQKLTIAEPDTVLTALSFAAFHVWWRGVEGGGPSLWRWLACGGLLAALSLAKGPQPAAFFAFGVGACILARREWRAMPGLIVCLSLPSLTMLAWVLAVHRPGDVSLWISEMRMGGGSDLAEYLRDRVVFVGGLMLELLPATLLLAVLLAERRRRQPLAVIAPLLAYSTLATLALAVWPHTRMRYAMPIAPAVAVLAGIAMDRLWRSHPWLTRGAAGVAGGLMAYQFILVLIVMPLFADRFGENRGNGQALARAIADGPRPVIATGRNTNEFAYVPFEIRQIDIGESGALPAPASLLTTREELASLAAARPDLSFRVLVETSSGPRLIAVRVDRR